MMKKLKYGLLNLIAFLGLASFCSAGSYTYTYDLPPGSYGQNNFLVVNPLSVDINGYIVYSVDCVSTAFNGTESTSQIQFGMLSFDRTYGSNSVQNVSRISQNNFFNSNGGNFHADVNYNNSNYKQIFGFVISTYSSSISTSETITISCTFSGSSILGGGGSCPECPTCPEVNTGEILSGYILESEIDTNYCVLNGYCPTNECTGDLVESGNWSALFINDIQHVSAPLINITIPEEFDWDYTGNEEEFDLEVKGYNVDTEYIDGIIKNQTTLPNDIDFNNTISGVLPVFVPGLVIILLIYFIFRFIKKIF